jgi:hypothetical protein
MTTKQRYGYGNYRSAFRVRLTVSMSAGDLSDLELWAARRGFVVKGHLIVDRSLAVRALIEEVCRMENNGYATDQSEAAGAAVVRQG